MMYRKITALALAAAMVVACGVKQQQQEEEVVAQVETSIVQKMEIDRTVEFSTTLEGYLKQNVAPSLTGKIEHIFVEVGTNVKEGSMLVRMDQNQINTTKLTYANLGVELSRMENLRESGAVSQQALDQVKLSYDQTKQSLDFLEKNTYVKAPFSGVISAKNYEDGELYSGQPILVLTQINTLKALIGISESYFPQVKAGMTVDITSDIYPGEVFKGVIEIVYPTIDASSHTFQVKVKISNGSLKLRPGMYVKTRLALGRLNAIVVPYQSVLKMTGSNDRYVFVNEDGVAKRIFVEMGQRYNEMVEIVGDSLHEGDKLVTLGQSKLVDGLKINVVKEN